MNNCTRAAFPLVAILCFFAVSSSVHAAVEISNGSVLGLWHLDGDGSDSSGNGYNGTSTAVSWVSGKLGTAGSFNSSTAKIDLPSFTATSTTLLAWIKTGDPCCPYIHLGNNSPQQMLWLDTNTSGNIRFAEYNGGYSDLVTASTNYADNAWHLVIGTREGNNVCIYVDDVSKGCGTLSPSTTVGGDRNAIGYDRFNGASYYGGLIDEVAVLSGVVTTSTRGDLWNGGAGSTICVTAGCDGASSGTPAIASLFQRKLDGSTSITEGSSTTETGVILGATLTSSSSNNLKLQVQVSTSSSFTNVLTGTSSAVSSGASTTVTVYGLANATYYWRGRALDADTNATSSWIQFEASGTADFVIDAPAAVEITNGSVLGLWHLESSGSDSSGNGYNGTSTAVSWVSGKFGSAGSFNSSSAKIDLPSFTTATATLIAWIKTSDPCCPFVHLGNNSPAQMLWLDTDGSGNVRFAEYNGAYSDLVTSGTSYADNAWHLVIGTRDGNTACLYVDNIYKGCGTLSPSAILGGDRNSIGYDRFNNTSYYGGLIDEVAVLNSVITTSTRGALWNGGAGRGICVTGGCSVGYTPLSGTINTSTTWTLAGSPYVVTSTVTIASGVRVDVEPGVVIKVASGTGISVTGTLHIDGTTSSLVYVTSYRDDSVGGDTNGDGTSTPTTADWGHIRINAGGVGTIEGAIIRYGGGTDSSGANIYNGGGTLSLDHADISFGNTYGLLLNSGTSTTFVAESAIHHNDYGIYLQGGSATVASSTIYNNSYGVYQAASPESTMTDNYWGGWVAADYASNAGPHHSSTNEDGRGNPVSDYIDYADFITAYLYDPDDATDVTGSSPPAVNPNNMQIKVGSSSAQYQSQLNLARQTWNASSSGYVTIVDASSSASSTWDVFVIDVNWATNTNRGQWNNATSGAPHIWLNLANISSNDQAQCVFTHELGHAMGLAHSLFNNNNIMAGGGEACDDGLFDDPRLNLGTQDLSDFNMLWSRQWFWDPHSYFLHY